MPHCGSMQVGAGLNYERGIPQHNQLALQRFAYQAGAQGNKTRQSNGGGRFCIVHFDHMQVVIVVPGFG